jgi:UDP-glucose 4-epimerase
MKHEDIKSILIIGMAGGLAKITARLLVKKYPNIKITGVDSRSISESIQNENIEYIRMRYTRGNFEKIFRDKEFDCVYHLGRMSHADTSSVGTLEQRLDLNLMGTKRILDLCLKFSVQKVIILSTYHVYGALSDNPVFINEDHPLRASIKHPELRDVVEMDQIATNCMWKYQTDIETVVLRPCTIVGPQIKNTMTRYLITPYAPVCADFNPMFQFIHEFDMANVLKDSIEKLPTGTYNVATDECASLKASKEILNCPTIPIPSFILSSAARLLNTGFWSFPRYLLDYIMFSCIIDNGLLKSHLGQDSFRYKTREALLLSKLD